MEKRTNAVSRPGKRIVRAEAVEYVIPLSGTGWVVKNSLAKKFTLISNSKREAIKIASYIAKQHGRELVVFVKDGSVQQRVSHAV